MTADQQIAEYARQEAAIMAQIESLRTMMTAAIGRLQEEADAVQAKKHALQDLAIEKVNREWMNRRAA